MSRHAVRLGPWWGTVVVGILLAGCSAQATTPTTATTPRGPTGPLSQSGIANWRSVGSYDESSLTAGEGVATVAPPGGAELPAPGHRLDPCEPGRGGLGAHRRPRLGRRLRRRRLPGARLRHSKMFLVTTPTGATTLYVHTLVPGKEYNNSFDSIAPGAHGWWPVNGTP